MAVFFGKGIYRINLSLGNLSEDKLTQEIISIATTTVFEGGNLQVYMGNYYFDLPKYTWGINLN